MCKSVRCVYMWCGCAEGERTDTVWRRWSMREGALCDCPYVCTYICARAAERHTIVRVHYFRATRKLFSRSSKIEILIACCCFLADWAIFLFLLFSTRGKTSWYIFFLWIYSRFYVLVLSPVPTVTLRIRNEKSSLIKWYRTKFNRSHNLTCSN